MLLFELNRSSITPKGIFPKLLLWAKSLFMGNKSLKYYASFSYYAISRLKMETGKDVSNIEEDVNAYECLFYHALVCGCEAEGVKPPSRDDVPKLINNNYVQIQNMMFESFKTLETEKKKMKLNNNQVVKMTQ